MAARQYVSVSGDPSERGEAIGRILAHSIRSIAAVQQEADYASGDPARPLLSDWLPQAEHYLPYIEQYAPRTFLEMRGMAKGAQCDFGTILLLTCVYEKHMGSGAAVDHCTAFAAWKEASEDGRLLCGQNNDERPGAGQSVGVRSKYSRYALLRRAGHGKADRVRRYREEAKNLLRKGGDETRLEKLHDGLAEGGEDFRRKVMAIAKGGHRETGGQRNLRRRIAYEDAIRAVEQVRGAKRDVFLAR